MMKVALFWWLQSQEFYKQLHKDALSVGNISKTDLSREWADVGCGMGLMSRLALEKGFSVSPYDLDENMVGWANFIHQKNEELHFIAQDIMSLHKKFDVLSATSLLSVVKEKKQTLTHLLSLLRDEESKLILIEPTEKLTLKNAWKKVDSLQTLHFYKLLLVWAKARETKAISQDIFNDIENISHYYFLDAMVQVTVIGKNYE